MSTAKCPSEMLDGHGYLDIRPKTLLRFKYRHLPGLFSTADWNRSSTRLFIEIQKLAERSFTMDICVIPCPPR